MPATLTLEIIQRQRDNKNIEIRSDLATLVSEFEGTFFVLSRYETSGSAIHTIKQFLDAAKTSGEIIGYNYQREVKGSGRTYGKGSSISIGGNVTGATIVTGDSNIL